MPVAVAVGGLFAQARRDLNSTKAEKGCQDGGGRDGCDGCRGDTTALETHHRAEESPDPVGQPTIRPAPSRRYPPRRSTVQER